MHCGAHAQLMLRPHQLNPVVRSVQYVSIGAIGVLVIMYNNVSLWLLHACIWQMHLSTANFCLAHDHYSKQKV